MSWTAQTRRTRPLVGISLAAALLLAPVLLANDWIAATWDGEIYDFDPLTGARSNPRATGIEDLCGIEFAADGTLIGMTAYTGQFNGQPAYDRLFRIDPATGAATDIGGGVSNANIEGGLALDPITGTMYGVQDVLPGPGDRLLFTIDLVLGTASTVGPVAGAIDMSGLAFDGAGNLFVLDLDSDLMLRLDPATAAVLATYPGPPWPRSVAGMTYDPDSGLILTLDNDGAFRSFNPATGQTSPVINDLDNLHWSGLARQPDRTLFADGFESGDTTAWSAWVAARP